MTPHDLARFLDDRMNCDEHRRTLTYPIRQISQPLLDGVSADVTHDIGLNLSPLIRMPIGNWLMRREIREVLEVVAKAYREISR